MLQNRQNNHQQDTFASSEEYYWNTGSVFFNQPQEVELWNLSVPSGEESLPTPPDTISECSSSSDFFEMTAPSWPNSSLPEEWAPFPAGNYRTMPQSCPEEWSSQGTPVTTQGLQALDPSYLHASHGSVVSGASPVLSHESQSSNTLPSLSEPESFLLPSAVDFSFNAEAGWSSSGPQIYNFPDVASPVSGHGPFPAYGQSLNMECGLRSAPAAYPGSQPQMFFPSSGQVSYQRRAVSHPHVEPVRTILPRTQSGLSVSSQPADGQRRSSRPYVQGSRAPRNIVSNVSTVSGHQKGTTQRTNSSFHELGYFNPTEGSQSHPVQGPVAGPAHIHPSMAGDFQSMPAPSNGVRYTPGHTGTTIPLAPMDNITPSGALSYPSGFDSFHPIQASVPEELHSASTVGPDFKSDSMDSKGSDAGSPPTTRDEASYRTDPLYDIGPQADGQYHCPFENDAEGCGHKPVKLRCNYAKYIDSHLKPFICTHRICTGQNQKFSSTACLLRHEREAHGMHGHGERPHACRYEGCERATEGNGFPRKYNLLDHMKRVHGFVDEEGQFKTKNSAGRKRKDAPEPEAAPKGRLQRQRPMSTSSRTRPAAPQTQFWDTQSHQVQGNLSTQDIMFAGWNGQSFGNPYFPASHIG